MAAPQNICALCGDEIAFQDQFLLKLDDHCLLPTEAH
jgi:hypothetical protein